MKLLASYLEGYASHQKEKEMPETELLLQRSLSHQSNTWAIPLLFLTFSHSVLSQTSHTHIHTLLPPPSCWCSDCSGAQAEPAQHGERAQLVLLGWSTWVDCSQTEHQWSNQYIQHDAPKKEMRRTVQNIDPKHQESAVGWECQHSVSRMACWVGDGVCVYGWSIDKMQGVTLTSPRVVFTCPAVGSHHCMGWLWFIRFTGLFMAFTISN